MNSSGLMLFSLFLLSPHLFLMGMPWDGEQLLLWQLTGFVLGRALQRQGSQWWIPCLHQPDPGMAANMIRPCEA